MLRRLRRFRISVAGGLLGIAVFALMLAILRWAFESDYTVVTSIEIEEDERPGRWRDADKLIRSPAVIAEAVASRTGSTRSAQEALERLIIYHSDSEHHLETTVQLRSHDPDEDRLTLDGLAQAFVSAYPHRRVRQLYSAQTFAFWRHGPWRRLFSIIGCILIGRAFWIVAPALLPRSRRASE